MEAQYGLETSIFQEIRKAAKGSSFGNFNYLDINWCDRRYTSPTSGKFTLFL